MPWIRILCWLLGHAWQDGHVYQGMTCDWCVRCGRVEWLDY